VSRPAGAALPFALALGLAATAGAAPAPRYDLLLRGGTVVDPRHGPPARRDVAIADGRIAAVAEDLAPGDALAVVDVSGLYVTPGLVDLHVHVYAGTGERDSYAGDNAVYPDGFTFRNGVTTVADAGGSGWRNFEDFKDRVVDRARTRVLAFLNIVGHGMRGGAFEQDLGDMKPGPAAEMALRHKGLIVGIKTAHYAGPEWTPVEAAVEAGRKADIPVMVDFGEDRPERPIEVLLREKLRPGDIYTHVYSGLRREQDAEGRVNAALPDGRKRGVLFDVGHGGGSFAWRIAVPAMKAGFLPDTLSTDLHVNSMNGGMKDLPNVMSKFLALGLSLEEVVRRVTWSPARALRHEELGHLSVGATADVAVLRLSQADYGYVDSFGARMAGRERLTCELTVRAGKVVYDLNGLSRPDWTTLPRDYKATGDPRWDGTRK
jgi:dihydroorotase